MSVELMLQCESWFLEICIVDLDLQKAAICVKDGEYLLLDKQADAPIHFQNGIGIEYNDGLQLSVIDEKA